MIRYNLHQLKDEAVEGELNALFSILRQQQDVDAYLQSICKTFNVVDRNVSHLAFNVRHEGAVQAGLQRKIFLRPSSFLAEANYVPRKEFTRRWHA